MDVQELRVLSLHVKSCHLQLLARIDQNTRCCQDLTQLNIIVIFNRENECNSFRNVIPVQRFDISYSKWTVYSANPGLFYLGTDRRITILDGASANLMQTGGFHASFHRISAAAQLFGVFLGFRQ